MAAHEEARRLEKRVEELYRLRDSTGPECLPLMQYGSKVLQGNPGKARLRDMGDYGYTVDDSPRARLKRLSRPKPPELPHVLAAFLTFAWYPFLIPMVKTFLLPGVLLALGLALPAAGQTKPKTVVTRPATTAAAQPLMPLTLNLLPEGTHMTLQVPKGTTASTNPYGVITITGPGVLFEVNNSTHEEDPFAGLKEMGDFMKSYGCQLVPTGNKLAIYGKNEYPPESDGFSVLVENPATHGYYFINSLRKDAKDNPLPAATTKASYAAALSARVQTP